MPSRAVPVCRSLVRGAQASASMPEHDEHCEADQNAAKQELRHGARPLLVCNYRGYDDLGGGEEGGELGKGRRGQSRRR